MPLSEIPAISTLGQTARDWLAGASSAEVAGITSRGVFLSLPGERVVFLSSEAYRGPLTLNLSGGLGLLARLPVRTPALIQNGSLIFPTIRFGLEFASSVVWEASPVGRMIGTTAGSSTYESMVGRLRMAARTALAGCRPTSPLAATLPWLLGDTPFTDGETAVWRSEVEYLQTALAAGNTPAIVQSLQACLGRGAGLTPSGDDLVMGALLALSRWGGCLASSNEPAALSESLLPAAWRLTTSLSACLIECASAGQADERLVDALDGIILGTGNLDHRAAGLRAWGSSSGVDALTGMALILMSCYEP